MFKYQWRYHDMRIRIMRIATYEISADAQISFSRLRALGYETIIAMLTPRVAIRLRVRIASARFTSSPGRVQLSASLYERLFPAHEVLRDA